MDKKFLKELRSANLQRQQLWHGDAGWPFNKWRLAMNGEIGEVQNVLKKLSRSEEGLTGNRKEDEELISLLGFELADVFTYLDLLTANQGFAMPDAFKPAGNILGRGFDRADLGNTMTDLSAAIGSSGRGQFALYISNMSWVIQEFARIYEIDLRDHIVKKFNEVSERNKFDIKLSV